MIKLISIVVFILVVAAPTVNAQSSVPMDTVITLHRLTDAFGDAPEYNLTIKADGMVTFKRTRSVFVPASDPRARDSEPVQSKVSSEIVTALVAAFERANFFSLKERYEKNEDGCPGGVWTDAPAAELSITLNGKSKTIFHYYGCLDQNRHPYPTELFALASTIDELVNTKQWLKP
ncbi:MAG: DUF6438 domain-containing protein [Acidobacteriota bacterium]